MTRQTKAARLIVGVGASAGGLEAFKRLLSVLPSDQGMAFLLVQHLAPTHESHLAELLTPCTPMAVRDAQHGLEIAADSVYIIPPDTSLAVRQGMIELTKPTLHRGVRLPVDHLFHSLAREYGSRSVGIILSGAGSDGSSGIRDIKAAGGLTIAEDPEESGQPGMPQSAIDTGVIDLVVSISEIPQALQRFVSLPPGSLTEPLGEELQEERSEEHSTLEATELNRLAALLEAQLDFDLRVYKLGTIERRVLRRMTLSGFEKMEPYLDHVRQDPSEQQALVRDLLISVTELYRDPESISALREMVIDPLVQQAAPGSTVRAWVPGCATGEEAFTIGIELLDAIVTQNKRIGVQIFATDVDQDALAYGRAGLYPLTISERVSPQKLQTYFQLLDGRGYRVRPALRDLVSFAAHDLTKDPPFSRMHLVSCRNVLIYLTPEAQKLVLRSLHFALEPDGHLFLSTSESTGSQRDIFSTISKGHRIYRKLGASPPLLLAHSRTRLTGRGDSSGGSGSGTAAARRKPSEGDLARRAVLEALAPPTIVVSEDGSVLFSHGELGPYLQIPQGDSPRLELGAILRPDIATRTRGVLYKCRRLQSLVTAISRPDGEARSIRISARPAPGLGDSAVILTFEEMNDTHVEPAERSESPGREAVIEQIEKELQATREDLRNTVEELETSNEELRSSNEASMSMNEELQSTNEELEATTEELRSLNEELTTVNAQLREKVEQLEQAHDDLGNFLSSTQVATVFLDERLCIKRFTPAAEELLDLDHADTGRCVVDIARELLQNDLHSEAKAVLDEQSFRRRDLLTSTGRWIHRSVLPYRTESRRIQGVVVTFTDVTALRSANEELTAHSRRLELAWEVARGGIYEHRVPLDESTYHSEHWAQILGYTRDELPAYDKFLKWLMEQVHPSDRDELDRAYNDFVAGRTEQCSVETRLRHRSGHWMWVRGVSKALERNPDNTVCHVLGMMIDITDIKQVEESLRESEMRFREMADGLPILVWVHDETGDQQLVNHTFCEFFGVDRQEMKGGRWQYLLHPDDVEAYAGEFFRCVREKRPFHAEARVKHAYGSWKWIESWARPRFTPAGGFKGFVGASADITDRRRIEDELRDSEERFRTLSDNIPQLAWMAQGDGWIFWYNQRWFEYTGTTLEQMKGWGWRSVHHPDHVDRVVEKVSHHFATGEVWEDTFPIRGADGEFRWFLSRAIPIRDEEGKVVRWFGTNTDVTEQLEAERRLMDADRQKDEFLAMLGHELRNPLAAIRTASELLRQRSGTAASIAETQEILERQTTHMSKLIDGLLDVSRIICGKIKLDLGATDLGAICREVSSEVRSRIAQRDLELRIEIASEPVWVEGDRVRLWQLVDNLLSNAVKYTPDGGEVSLSLERGRGEAVLQIRDTGVGIEPELLPHVFELFRQSEQSLDRSEGGLGLGLAFVKTIVELHHGTVTAHSEGKGRGAELVVTLPTIQPPGQAKRQDLERSDRSRRILLIEDNRDAAVMLKFLLELAGHQVHIAANGQDGVNAARELRPDIVLCDLGLPDGMSGYDVATELQGDPATCDIHLVALSGYGRPEDKARCAEAGFDDHLTKPVDIQELEDLLAALPPRDGNP
ncbi:MAG: PAS domain S-box protein [Planctomycetota bacterium]